MDEHDSVVNFDDNWDNYTYYYYTDNPVSDQHLKLIEIERILKLFCPPILISFGVVANLICFLVFAHLSFGSKYPSCTFLMFISITDTILLFLETGNKWMETAVQNNMMKSRSKQSELNCKVFAFVGHMASALDNWILVVLLIEGIYIIHSPKKVINLTGLYVKDTLVILLVIFVLVDIHYFWTFGLVSINVKIAGYGMLKEKYCMFQVIHLSGEKYPDEKLARVWSFIFITVGDVLPMAFICVLLLCFYILKKPASKEKHIQICQRSLLQNMTKIKTWEDRIELYHINVKTVLEFAFHVYPLLGILFLISNVPNFIMSTLDFYILTESTTGAVWTFVFTVLYQVKHLFHSTKIIVYVIQSRQVRGCIAAMLTKSYKFFRNHIGFTCKTNCCTTKQNSATILL